MIILDYVFYKWVQFYKKLTSKPQQYSSLVLSVYFCMTILDIWLLIDLIFEVGILKKEIILILVIASYIFNYIRYERNFNISNLNEKWKNDKNSEVKWIIIVIYLFLLFAFPIGLGLSKLL